MTGFLGVMIVVWPDDMGWKLAYALPLFATVMIVFREVYTKRLPHHYSGLEIVLITGLLLTIAAGLASITVLADPGLEHFVSNSWSDFSGYRCPCDDCAYCQAGTTFSHLSRTLFDHHLWRHQCFYHSSGSTFKRHHHWFDHRHQQWTLPFGIGKTEVMIKDYIKLEVSPGCLKGMINSLYRPP